MRDFARLAGHDRAALFQETAARRGLALAIVEKDFWVCWMLDRLWTSPFAPHLLFKGGTSLSKCFGLIERFSEDIDIGLDRTLLDLPGDAAEPGLSRSQRNKRVDALKTAAKSWIETTFLQTMSEAIRAELGEETATGWNWETETDLDGMAKLRWNPPLSQPKRRRAAHDFSSDYLVRGVLVEIGSRAAHWPAAQHDVSPYVAQQIPQAFSVPATRVCTLEVGRTFWEKATILHVLNHETQHDLEAGKPARPRERHSRHCLDLHCIARSSGGEAFARDSIY